MGYASDSVLLSAVVVLLLVQVCTTTEITPQVFGSSLDGIPAAFGDFNSDDLTDLFVTRNDGHILEILLGSSEGEPLLSPSNLNLSCTLEKSCRATSVVPGDFNGDAFMDVLITTVCDWFEGDLTYVHILYGRQTTLNCSYNEKRPVLKTCGEPLALDYNEDFVIDLFGMRWDEEKKHCERGFWIFHKEHSPHFITQTSSLTLPPLHRPHSSAILDLNGDNMADLFVTAGKSIEDYQFEIWDGSKDNFVYTNLTWPPKGIKKMGQSIFLDLELKGAMDHLLPVIDTTQSRIYVFSNNTWNDLKVNFVDNAGVPWGFYYEENGPPFVRTVTLRGGDYNMDGYPDLLATLQSKGGSRTFLLENTPCYSCDNFTRNFQVRWAGFGDTVNNTVLGVFYDIFQDGILDVILVKHVNQSYQVSAYKNTLDYDANFVKVMVLTGLNVSDVTLTSGPLGKRKRTFGTNLPGPRISYKTTDQDGYLRAGVSAQIPQSAHYALHLPYTMFALGRTPNFVDNITVGFAGYQRDWPQIIPNSQMVVIPTPLERPSQWRVQLFVTPSNVILKSGVALLGTCVFILLVIAVLHWKERKVDRLERLQETYRFNFDAM